MEKKIRMEGESDVPRWHELIPDVLGLIFIKLPLQVILQVIPMVCKSWCKAVEGPYCWLKIDVDEWRCELSPKNFDRMLRMLIPRCSGSLHELSVSFIDNDQMLFIAENAGSLQTLRLRHSSVGDSIVEQVVPKLSSLTTLDIIKCRGITTRSLESIGRHCQMLVSLTWIEHLASWIQIGKLSLKEYARAVARTMPNLKHLEIASSCSNINTSDALEILAGCPELKTLNVRGCGGITTLDVDILEEKYPEVRVLGGIVFYEEWSD